MRLGSTNRVSIFLTLAVTIVASSCAGESFKGGNKTRQPEADSTQQPGTLPESDLPKSCVPEPLPTSVVTPRKLFTYLPVGDSAPFNEFVSTVAVGRLKKEDATPSILAIGMKKASTVNGRLDCSGAVFDPGRLFAIDGKTGAHKWIGRTAAGATAPVPVDVDAVVAPAIADINGDGKMEVFAIERTTGFVVAFDSDGVVIWKSPVSTGSRSGQGSSLGVASMWAHGISINDLDNDGVPEVVAPGMVLDSRSGAKKFDLPKGRHVYPANVNLSGDSEIVVSTGVVSAAGTTICRFSKELANIGIARLKKSDNFLTVVGPSLSTQESPGVQLMAYRADTCGLLFEKSLGDAGGGPPNIADFDGAPDQNLEIGIAGQTRYAVFNSSGTLLWSRPTRDASSARTGSTAFDFNGDGKTEVVYNDELFLRVFDGASGTVLYEAPNTSYTAHEYPVVADVDGNGTANIVAVSNDCANPSGNVGVNVFSEPDDHWVRTRPVWSQHGFDALGINDDGTVTMVDPVKILAGALPSAHLVGFRNNIPYPRDPAQCR